MPDKGARQLHRIELSPDPPLQGPPPGATTRGGAPQAVTGGGLVAIVDPAEGLLGVWEGATRERLALPAILGTAPSRRLLPLSFVTGGGAWERTIEVGEATSVERGCLPDSAPAILVGRWSESDRVASSAVQELFALTLGEVPEARLLPVQARERARAARAPEPPSRLQMGERDVLADLIQTLDDAACGVGDGREPRGPFVLGVSEGEPLWLEGTALAEVALGTLGAGRPELALSLFREAAGDRAVSALALVHLGARLAEWTGEPRLLLPWQSLLGDAAAALLAEVRAPGRNDAGAPAAFPMPQRALEELAAAVEPLGGDWSRELKELARAVGQAELERGTAGSAPGEPGTSGDAGRAGSGSGAGGPRGILLPVIGNPSRVDEVAPPRAPEAQLPPPRSFAPLDSPSIAARRTLHAARALRSWVEGALGVRPDGAWGRLRLAPDLVELVPGGGAFFLKGLRMADASVAVDCRLDGSSCTFRVFQEGGRVPVNVVFEPRLPLAGPLRVTIGGDEAEVRTTAVEGGVRLSCQFPLDPERRIVIEQRS